MKLFKILICLVFIFMILIAFKYNNEFDYSKVRHLKFEDCSKIKIKVRIKNASQVIVIEKENPKYAFNKNFSGDDRSLLKKYGGANLFKTRLDQEFLTNDIYIDNKMVFAVSGNLLVEADGIEKETGVVFEDNDKNLIALTNNYGIDIYNPYLKKRSNLLDLEIKLHSPDDITIYRLLDAKGEWLLVLGIYHDYSYQEVDELHNHFKIYKYNLKTKEVRIWDSRDYNLTMYIDTYYLNYDLSKDRRYIYMSFMYGYNGYDGEKDKISEGGVYVFDWWEERLYKIFEPMPINNFKKLAMQKIKSDGSIYYEIDVKVVNNTDDGYVYAMWAGTNEDFQYIRFKNPEDMLK